MNKLLDVKNLRTQFLTEDGIIRAVNDVSFDMYEGETLGLVGESGCGKSVSALSLMGLIPNPPGKIVGGEILFDGKNLLECSEKEMCRVRGNKMAMVFQEPMTSLNPVYTIGRQTSEILQLHKKMKKGAALDRAVSLLSKVKISDAPVRIRSYPHQFSGGMRQRVMIAMSMACVPRLIIADEPTTALDVTIQLQLMDLLKQLSREYNTSLLIITHNLGIVARYADRINVMYAGRIVEKAIAADLYANPGHPYTLGLMESVPRLDRQRKTKLIPIEGQPPDLLAMPPGCSFHPRCRFATDRCRQEAPELRTVSENHEIACWNDVKQQ